jgi:hypothetical protein
MDAGRPDHGRFGPGSISYGTAMQTPDDKRHAASISKAGLRPNMPSWNAARRATRVAALGGLLLTLMAVVHPLAACPFCKALLPTLAQRREAADVVLLGELIDATREAQQFKIHQVFKGAEANWKTAPLVLPTSLDAEPGTLVLLFGGPESDQKETPRTWQTQQVSERSLVYFAKAPSLREPAPRRLGYYAPYLEDKDPLISEDAYFEFGHSPYDVVVQVADQLPMDRIRGWLVSPHVVQDRKGFYGVALGMATDKADQKQNRDLLREQILKPSTDFRGGFDGILGGYLLLAPEEGLALLETRYLADPQSADGDVRHALSAIRFYQQYGREIRTQRLAKALVPLLGRTEFAAVAIVDLSRMGAWQWIDRVVPLFDDPAYPQPRTGRSVVGYLNACPRPEAEVALRELQKKFPQRVEDAQRDLSLFGSGL